MQDDGATYNNRFLDMVVKPLDMHGRALTRTIRKLVLPYPMLDSRMFPAQRQNPSFALKMQ
eukprot:scaffold793_cov64-Cylindrotheca_fusiformis.AAC.1